MLKGIKKGKNTKNVRSRFCKRKASRHTSAQVRRVVEVVEELSGYGIGEFRPGRAGLGDVVRLLPVEQGVRNGSRLGVREVRHVGDEGPTPVASLEPSLGELDGNVIDGKGVLGSVVWPGVRRDPLPLEAHVPRVWAGRDILKILKPRLGRAGADASEPETRNDDAIFGSHTQWAIVSLA